LWQQHYRKTHARQIQEKSRRQYLRRRSDADCGSRRKHVEERAQARWKVRAGIKPERHLDLVKQERQRFFHISFQDGEELHSSGLVALVEASRKFDPRSGVPFRAFARLKVRWAMRDEWDRLKRFQREVETVARLEHSNIVTAFDEHVEPNLIQQIWQDFAPYRALK
jgi:DNA-directed RNA polymerase specialized sigma subunit